MKTTEPELPCNSTEEAESQPTSPTTVVLAVLLISIPLALCCYLLLR